MRMNLENPCSRVSLYVINVRIFTVVCVCVCIFGVNVSPTSVSFLEVTHMNICNYSKQ